MQKNIEYQLISNAWINYMTAKYMSKNNTSGSIIQIGSIYGHLAQDINLYNKSINCGKLIANINLYELKLSILLVLAEK